MSPAVKKGDCLVGVAGCLGGCLGPASSARITDIKTARRGWWQVGRWAGVRTKIFLSYIPPPLSSFFYPTLFSPSSLCGGMFYKTFRHNCAIKNRPRRAFGKRRPPAPRKPKGKPPGRPFAGAHGGGSDSGTDDFVLPGELKACVYKPRWYEGTRDQEEGVLRPEGPNGR